MSPPAPDQRQFLQLQRRLRQVQHRLYQVQSWAWASVAVNGVLLLGLVLLLLRRSPPPEPSPVLVEANAFASEQGSSGGSGAGLAAVSEEVAAQGAGLTNRLYLDYQQWVTLLTVEAKANATAPRQHVLLGDSLSLWFPPELLPEGKTWLNQAISGERSAGLRQRLHILDDNDPEAVFVMIGINDLIWGETDQALLDNTEGIVQSLRRRHPEAKIVLQSILPHGGHRSTWEGRDKVMQVPTERIRALNASLQTLAVANGVHFLNLYPLFADSSGLIRPGFTTDGVHLSREGYLVWRSALLLSMDAP